MLTTFPQDLQEPKLRNLFNRTWMGNFCTTTPATSVAFVDTKDSMMRITLGINRDGPPWITHNYHLACRNDHILNLHDQWQQMYHTYASSILNSRSCNSVSVAAPTLITVTPPVNSFAILFANFIVS